MIEFKLETSDFFGTAVATCMAFMYDVRINYSGNVQTIIKSGAQNSLTISLEGKEHKLELAGKSREEIVDWVAETLGVFYNE